MDGDFGGPLLAGALALVSTTLILFAVGVGIAIYKAIRELD